MSAVCWSKEKWWIVWQFTAIVAKLNWIELFPLRLLRSNHSKMSYKTGVQFFFCKVHRKTPALESLESHIKKRLQHRCFPVNIVKFFRIAFLQNTSRRLHLKAIFQMFLSWCLVFFGNFPAYVLSWVYLSHWGSRVLPST